MTSTTSQTPFQVSSSSEKHRAGTGGTSSRKFSGKFSGKPDVLTYRQHFAKTWQSFIVGNFDDAAHAAYFFKVDPSTANNWFDGLNAPQGWVVGRAFSDPILREAALCMLGVVE